MGLPAITVPEARGGGGAGFVDLGHRGRVPREYLAPVPLVEAAVATDLLATLSEGAGGELSHWRPARWTGSWSPRWRCSRRRGVARLVPAGAVADLVVVLDGTALLVRPAGQAVRRRPAEPRGPPLADCPVTRRAVVLARGRGGRGPSRGVRQWQLLTGTALAGLAARALDMGIEYVCSGGPSAC